MRLFSHPELAGVRRISRHADGNVSRLRALRAGIGSGFSLPDLLKSADAAKRAATVDLFFAGSEPENKP